jgi:hypothetical protein
MDFFFEPRGVAVVGATPERYQGGQYLMANLTLGYDGPIYPVNPKYDEVLGMKCYLIVCSKVIKCRMHFHPIIVESHHIIPNFLEVSTRHYYISTEDCVSRE